MLAFAEELSSPCSPSAQDACTDAQRALYAEYEAMAVSELKSKAGELMSEAEMAKMRSMMTQMQVIFIASIYA